VISVTPIKPRDVTKIGNFVIVGFHWRTCVDAATRYGDDKFTSSHMTLNTIRIVVKVFPARTMWSIQAFRSAGMAKLYIGTPMTITSEASNSAVSSSEIASTFLWAFDCVSGAVKAPMIQSRLTKVRSDLVRVAFEALVESLTQEVARFGIHVTLVEFGPFVTEFMFAQERLCRLHH
jgi:hypothetical protein